MTEPSKEQHIEVQWNEAGEVVKLPFTSLIAKLSPESRALLSTAGMNQRKAPMKPKADLIPA